jgi:PhnB protein
MNKSVPEGWHSITPRLVTDDVARLVAFLKHAFAATGDYREDRPSEIRIGDSLILISEVGVRKFMPAFLYLYLDDVDGVYQRAIDAGAESIEQPQDMPYGDRRAMIKDPGGNTWQIATHNEKAFRAFLSRGSSQN